MDENISSLKKSLQESFEDYVITRRERGELRKLVAGIPLTPHQRSVLLSEARSMAAAGVDTHRGQLVVEWMYEVFKILGEQKQEKGSKPRVYFSPGTACREAICSHIRFARHTISICVFTISDDEITEELLVAHRRGVDISIITDDDKSFDLGSDINRLDRMGLDVITDRSPVHMHHKFALFDEDTVLTGSYNWTRSAADHNYENIIVLKDPIVFAAYEREFKRLWKQLR
jgi:phosphatidylserine/phosphatidylglycerophosphate/cardiolipin synthase-like enzyme